MSFQLFKIINEGFCMKKRTIYFFTLFFCSIVLRIFGAKEVNYDLAYDVKRFIVEQINKKNIAIIAGGFSMERINEKKKAEWKQPFIDFVRCALTKKKLDGWLSKEKEDKTIVLNQKVYDEVIKYIKNNNKFDIKTDEEAKDFLNAIDYKEGDVETCMLMLAEKYDQESTGEFEVEKNYWINKIVIIASVFVSTYMLAKVYSANKRKKKKIEALNYALGASVFVFVALMIYN